MKRSWIGGGLLVGLLLLGLLTGSRMQRIHEPLARDIRRAAALAAAGNWQEAEDYVNRVERIWTDNWGFAASFSDHEPMEEVKSLFAQLRLCAELGDSEACALICAELVQALSAMGEAHRITWWNLL